jgi:lipopolysaccharide/colanic/teichoic acid biosynthesis glycosyltransferase
MSTSLKLPTNRPAATERPSDPDVPVTRLAANGPLVNEAPSDPEISAVPLPANWYIWCKPGVEFAAALVLLAFAEPIILAAALLVKLTSRGPAFYSQTRLGQGGRAFTLYKVRTMAHDCEKGSGARWSTPGDPRITPVGAFLRKTHLDELPQLWNVLRGDMSLVGPRPERPEFIPALERALPHYRDRLAVRPGVTGLAQVQLPPDTDLDSVRRKLAYDLYYIRYLNGWLDFRLIACTALYMVGVPYHALNRWFSLPSKARIEYAYQVEMEMQPGVARLGPA